MRMKKEISSEDLCDGLPDEFRMFLDYAKQLGFCEKPDYSSLRLLFHKLLVSTEPNKSLWLIQ